MIYCSLEPGLLIFEGLRSHEIGIAFSVLDALIVHRTYIVKSQARIPVTSDFIALVIASLSRIHISNPPLENDLRRYILEILTRQASPALLRTGVADINITPDIVSGWIDDGVRKEWLDCVSATLLEILSIGEEPTQKAELFFAAWKRDNLQTEVVVSSGEIQGFLNLDTDAWHFPLLAYQHDWDAIFASSLEWPQGLDKMVESYARRYFNISEEDISKRREVRFDKGCLESIANERNPKIRGLLIEVIACRAYDRPRSNHHDEAIKTQPGTRRVYIRKMNPPIRLHYHLDKGRVVYVLYSAGEHEKGL